MNQKPLNKEMLVFISAHSKLNRVRLVTTLLWYALHLCWRIARLPDGPWHEQLIVMSKDKHYNRMTGVNVPLAAKPEYDPEDLAVTAEEEPRTLDFPFCDALKQLLITFGSDRWWFKRYQR